MTPTEVAQWMKEEHQRVDELARALHDRVAVVPRTNLKAWIQATRTSLGDFQSHLLRHFDIEEDGGYLQAVVDRRPTLSGEVDRLRHEHDELGRMLGSIHRDLETLTDQDRLLIEDLCARVSGLLRYIREHEDRENLMVVSVFTHDLGTKD